MDLKKIDAVIESVLFAAGEPVEIEKLCDILDIDKNTLRAVMARLMDAYNYEQRGIHVIQLGNSYQMCTRSEYFDYIQKLVDPKRNQSLSSAALEILAIIAYRQPITKSTIENIRGVSCETAVNRLLERDLIEEKGRLEAPGKPILFGTTNEFLRMFGLKSLADMPNFDTIAISDDESEPFLQTL